MRVLVAVAAILVAAAGCGGAEHVRVADDADLARAPKVFDAPGAHERTLLECAAP